MVYEILNQDGEVINRIVADQEFVEKYYPGRYRLEEIPDLEVEGEIDMEDMTASGKESKITDFE